ncbi:hypothetical protein BDY19DRAFT_997574 [Irpex rosettiformis]|uniref:Uncharacterized protein n=1 Tax=Irpex rosettiformis TaxID=378272 RepID=A0ACB8TRH6_9APHY|nr:hypothetical protein BDY19DRAFT_997574 [Irpex rosettiformis]
MALLAATIPPELFEVILLHVGDEDRLRSHENAATRREEMKHLSACALTCVYWAQLTRARMFRLLVLRSSKDLRDLRSILLLTAASDRLAPIGKFLASLVIYYKLGEPPWFYNAGGLKTSGAERLLWVYFHVIGPEPPAFTVGNTRRSVLHPLFYSVPRILPMTSFHKLRVYLYVENIHFTNPTTLCNLLRDCKLLQPREMHCINLTWDHDSDSTAPPSSVNWKFTHHSDIRFVSASQCTDNVLAAAMTRSVPNHEFFLRRHGPHLNSTDSSCLGDIMRASCGQSPNEQGGPMNLVVESFCGLEDVGRLTPATLPVDSDLAFGWWEVYECNFHCIASRKPGDDSSTRYITHIIIQPHTFADILSEFRKMFRAIDWGAFLRCIQALPDLRGIIIQCSYECDIEDWYKCLVELVTLLREAWAGVDPFLQLLYGNGISDTWTQVELSTVLEYVDKAEKESTAHSSSNPQPTPELGSESSNGQRDQIPDHSDPPAE